MGFIYFIIVSNFHIEGKKRAWGTQKESQHNLQIILKIGAVVNSVVMCTNMSLV